MVRFWFQHFEYPKIGMVLEISGTPALPVPYSPLVLLMYIMFYDNDVPCIELVPSMFHLHILCLSFSLNYN